MKILSCGLFLLFLLAGCEEKPKNPVAEYGDTMINSYQKGRQAAETGNLDAVRDAVKAYHAANDAYPRTLDEIEPLLGTAVDFSAYEYNPHNGTVALRGN